MLYIIVPYKVVYYICFFLSFVNVGADFQMFPPYDLGNHVYNHLDAPIRSRYWKQGTFICSHCNEEMLWDPIFQHLL